MSFRDKLIRFMSGRYGEDQLSRAVLWTSIGLAALNLLLRTWVVYALGCAGLAWMVFRMFSRSIPARQAENRVFLRVWGRVRAFCVLQKNRIRDIRTHVYRTCPHCHAALRFARHEGAPKQVRVTCPRCRRDFTARF